MSKLVFIILFIILKINFIKSIDIDFEDEDSVPKLYSANDTGLILVDSTSLNKTLFNNDRMIIFEFYNSWCGHCIRFAPIWIEFGKQVANWQSVVNVVALNCVENESNLEVCRNYNITSYPSVRFFWSNVQPNSNDFGKQIENLQASPEFLKNATIEFLHSNLDKKPIPKSWPNLKKVTLTKNDQIRNLFTATELTNEIPKVAIAEKNDSFIGQQLILELANYRDKLQVLSLDIPLSNELNFTVDTTKTALLQLDPKFLTYKLLTTLPLNEKNQTAYYVNYINQNLFDNKLIDKSKEIKNVVTTSASQVNLEANDVPLTMNDIYGAVSYTLHHQIPLKRHMNSTQLNILKRFFDVLEKYFPADDEKFVVFLKNLNQFIKSKDKELEINDYLNYLKKNDYDFKSKFSHWITCKGSSTKYRGYPCSLWSLFHTLTLQEYLKEQNSQKWVNLHEVLFTMRDYIGNFFSCTNCAGHFVKMASNLENELKFPNSSVLWLWRSHNKVNLRLHGDLTEDPEHPKALYPYTKNCPNCYLNEKEFNEEEAFKYLIDRYGFLKNKKTENKPTDELKENKPTDELKENKSIKEETIIKESMDKPMDKPMDKSMDKPMDNLMVKTVDKNESNDQPKPDLPKSEQLRVDSDNTFRDAKVFNYTDYSIAFGLYILTAAIVMSVFFYLPRKMLKRRAKSTKTRYLDV